MCMKKPDKIVRDFKLDLAFRRCISARLNLLRIESRIRIYQTEKDADLSDHMMELLQHLFRIVLIHRPFMDRTVPCTADRMDLIDQLRIIHMSHKLRVCHHVIHR